MMPESPRKQAERLVRLHLDERLADANHPPGVREAVIHGLAKRVDEIMERSKDQVRQLRSPSSDRIPDLYAHFEEEIENLLQRAAAGIRAASASQGFLVTDPGRFEATWASSLAPTARWALLEEASRIPRPTTRHHVLARSLMPMPWMDDDEWPPLLADELKGIRSLTGNDGDPVRVVEHPYIDWVQLGMLELQESLASSHPKRPHRTLLALTGLEVSNASIPSWPEPIGTNPPDIWMTRYDALCEGCDQEEALRSLPTLQGPLAAIADYQGQVGAPDRMRGLGRQPFILVPRLELVAFLDLRPESPAVRHCLIDNQGPAVVGRNWRGFLIHDGNYEPLTPGVHGADLIIRPDLHERLVRVLREDRIRSGISVRHFEGEDDELA